MGELSRGRVGVPRQESDVDGWMLSVTVREAALARRLHSWAEVLPMWPPSGACVLHVLTTAIIYTG